MGLKRLHLHVSGRVQGVFYRARTQEKARSLGLTGWVRNLPDGSVEALFEGEEDVGNRGIEKCRQGPPSASVDNVEISWQKASGEFRSFDIRY